MALNTVSHQLPQSPQTRTALALSPVHFKAWAYPALDTLGHSCLQDTALVPGPGQALSDFPLSVPVSEASRGSGHHVSAHADPEAGGSKGLCPAGCEPHPGLCLQPQEKQPPRLFWKANRHLGSLHCLLPMAEWQQVTEGSVGQELG